MMASDYMARVGERIRTRRDELGLSRGEVARKMPGKTNENAVYRWENGLHRPQDDTLEALARVLQTTVTYFLADEQIDSGQRDDMETRLNKRLDEMNERIAELRELLASERAASDVSQDDPGPVVLGDQDAPPTPETPQQDENAEEEADEPDAG